MIAVAYCSLYSTLPTPPMCGDRAALFSIGLAAYTRTGYGSIVRGPSPRTSCLGPFPPTS